MTSLHYLANIVLGNQIALHNISIEGHREGPEHLPTLYAIGLIEESAGRVLGKANCLEKQVA